MTTDFDFIVYCLNPQVFILGKNAADEIESSQLGFSLCSSAAMTGYSNQTLKLIAKVFLSARIQSSSMTHIVLEKI